MKMQKSLLAFMILQISFSVANAVDLSPYQPPKAGSPADRKDIQISLQYQWHRTPEQCQKASEEVGLTFDAFIAPQGPLTREEASVVSELADEAYAFSDSFVYALKAKWNRPRPFLRNIGIENCIESHASTSFPSGHATVSKAMADVISYLIPEKAVALQKRAKQIAIHRVLSGVHHQSDIDQGRRLGAAAAREFIAQHAQKITEVRSKLKLMKDAK